MTMPASNHPQVTIPPLSERENTRIVDLIEFAERDHPFCECGAANAAIVHGDVVWLECGTLRQPRAGLRGILERYSAFHTHRRITELGGSLTEH